jgi:hypothetical protein
MRTTFTKVTAFLIRPFVQHRVAILNAMVISMVAVGATVVAMKSSREKSMEKPLMNSQAANRDGRVGAALQTIAHETEEIGQTGQARPLTADEARKLADGVKVLVNQSGEGLTEIHHDDGSVSIDLQGRFQNVILASKADDGKVSQACVNNPQNAAQFLGIDPQLISNTPNDKAVSTRKAAAKVAAPAPNVTEELK